jgi:AcrR family transcriptional regulator
LFTLTTADVIYKYLVKCKLLIYLTINRNYFCHFQDRSMSRDIMAVVEQFEPRQNINDTQSSMKTLSAVAAPGHLTEPNRKIDHPALKLQPDRASLTDIALDLFRWRGYDATTVDHIAATAGITPQDFGRYFATKDAIITSLIDEVLQGGVASLARVPPNTDPLDALLIVYIETLRGITNGVGVITRERLVPLAHILTAQPDLREHVRAVRRRVLMAPLAEHTGVAPDDRRMRHAFTMWAAIVTGSYNFFDRARVSFDRAGVGPSGDGRVPELMARRLNETFAQVTGREPPQQAIELASAPPAWGA